MMDCVLLGRKLTMLERDRHGYAIDMKGGQRKAHIALEAIPLAEGAARARASPRRRIEKVARSRRR